MNTAAPSEPAGQNGNGVGVVHTQTVRLALPAGGLSLECGRTLPELDVAYETYGELSPAGDNVIFICHALTGDAHVAGVLGTPDGPPGWWDEMIGPGRGIDTTYYHVVCANILGGCRGTTGPSSIDPGTGKPYGAAFPPISVADIVDVHMRLLQHLGITELAAVIGGSFGGMQVLDWAIRYPDQVKRAICIASAASLSSQALAFDIVGRSAITDDPDWQGGDYADTGRVPASGLALARKIGHITYLSPELMSDKFGRKRQAGDRQPATGFQSDFAVESYLAYQGTKFVGRFDANSYLHITAAMDDYDIAQQYGSLESAFRAIEAKLLIVALSADWLFPAEQSRELANTLLRAGKAASYCLLHAPHGHDAFLVDIEHLAEVLRAFLPWVTSGGRVRSPANDAQRDSRRREFDIISDMIETGASVVDIGCGNGELLTRLKRDKQVTGLGVDIAIGHVIEVIDAGHDMFQADIDAGLAMIPDTTYDYAVLSETLQVVHNPLLVLREMLRVARECIVSFPNFANWAHRWALLRGHMPRSRVLPFEWYDTPNIHLFTRDDFVELCRREGLQILDTVCVGENPVSRALVRLRRCNLGADRVLARLTKGSGAPQACRPGFVRD